MMERVEMGSLNRAEPVSEVGQPRENSLQRTDKPFVAELEEKISDKKKKEKKNQDKIILHDEKASPEKDENKENKQENKPNQPSPDGQKGNRVDLLA